MRSRRPRHAAPGAHVDERHLGAHAGGVAHERDALLRHRREQAEQLRRVEVEVVAERAGDVDAVELLERHAETLEQQLPARRGWRPWRAAGCARRAA